MPLPPSKSSKLTLPKVAMYLVAAIAVFLVLRFVFSVGMGILKYVVLGAVVVFVVWLFVGKDNGSGKSG